MTIRQAYSQMTIQDFVNWALANNYPYTIVCSNSRECGTIYSKSSSNRRKYPFDYKPKLS
jgi:hypothetical protein